MNGDGSTISAAAAERLIGIISEKEPLAAEPCHPDYTIERIVARGGMGTVYLAYDKKLRRRVAMKVMHEPGAALRGRFDREAVSTANLQHPNIVPVFDYGALDDGRPFYTMKLVEGRGLRELIVELHAADDPRARLPSLLRLICQICDALSYAHHRGVTHRDLKPDNVMVGQFNQICVLDWGLIGLNESPNSEMSTDASRLSPLEGCGHVHATGAGAVMGTPAYMSPEQAAGDNARIGPASDVYAVGAMLLEVLTARAPFADMPAREIIQHVRDGGRPLFNRGSFPIPAPLRSIVRQAMQPEPSQRYAGAQELADDLRRWMDGQPVRAHRESWLERFGRLARRYRAAIVVIVCYLLMRAGVLWLLGR